MTISSAGEILDVSNPNLLMLRAAKVVEPLGPL